jgi:hypothetical protein
METISEIRDKTCRSCNQTSPLQNEMCLFCGEFFAAQDGLAQQMAHPKSLSGNPNRYATRAVYTTAGINFALGIIEGFVDNNSAAMAINFFISLIILCLAPGSLKYPMNSLLICLALNVSSQIISPLFQLFPFQHWLAVKLLVFAIPLIGIVMLILARRPSTTESNNR